METSSRNKGQDPIHTSHHQTPISSLYDSVKPSDRSYSMPTIDEKVGNRESDEADSGLKDTLMPGDVHSNLRASSNFSENGKEKKDEMHR